MKREHLFCEERLLGKIGGGIYKTMKIWLRTVTDDMLFKLRFGSQLIYLEIHFFDKYLRGLVAIKAKNMDVVMQGNMLEKNLRRFP